MSHRGSREGVPRTSFLLVGALVLKAVVLAQLHHHPLLQPEGGLDSEVYVRLARQAAVGDWGLGPDAYFIAPFYVYFLAVVFIVSGGSLLAAKVVQIVLGTVAVGLIFATAARWYGRRGAWVAGVLAAATGVFTFNEVLLLQSAVDPFLTALGLYLLARALASERVSSFAVAGVALGLFVTNRPNVLLWAAGLVTTLALTPPSRRSLLRAAAVLGGAALAVGPVAVRNRVVSGEWILVSSHGGLNFYIGNNPGADGTYRSVPGIAPDIEGQVRDARTVAEAAAGRPLSASEVAGHFYRRAWEWIATYPGPAFALFLRKLAYCFSAIDLSLNYSYAYYSRDEPTLLRYLVVGPWLLVPLGLLGLAAAPRRANARGFWIWAAFVPVYAVSVAAFFVSGRYRLPLLVPLCVGAGPAAAWLVDAVRERRRRPLLLAAAALTLLGLATNWNWRLDDGRSEERTQMIVRLVDEGRLDEARALLARTRPGHPEPALLLYRVGRALHEQGRPADAAELLEQALRAEPDRSETRRSLGASLLDAGRRAVDREETAAAEGFLARAVQVEPANAATREAHGVALSLLGRQIEAASELEEAARLDPASPSVQLNLAVVEAQLGRYAEARARAEEALRLRPGYPQARGLLDKLRQTR